MAYGILLLPDHATSARLVAYAKTLVRNAPVTMCVDEVRRPHVTLLHVDSGRNAAEELWQHTCATVVLPLTVSLSGTQVSPIAPGDYYVPEGGVYSGLEAVRQPNLDRAHQQVLEHAITLSLRPLGGVGAQFRPHVTLAVLENAERISVPVPPAELLRPFEVRLAWGELAPCGTFPHVIEALDS
jgi:hypothetical protein